MEFFIQLLAELLLQLMFEGVADLTFRKWLSEEPGLLRFAIFTALGTISGLLSLLFFRHHLVVDFTLRLLALFIIPVLVAFLMAKIGRMRRKRGGADHSLEHFFASWGFAFAFGLMRTAFAQ